MTEKLLTGTLSLNTTNQHFYTKAAVFDSGMSVRVRNEMQLLLYLENQYSIETIGLCVLEVWKQIYKINMCMYLVFD